MAVRPTFLPSRAPRPFLACREAPRARPIASCVAAEHILRVAARVEPDTQALLSWFDEDPIACLGGRTAAELVAQGDGELVLRFVERIGFSERGIWPVH